MDENNSVEIIGMSDTPVTVDGDLNVTQSAPAGEQDIMEDMRAAVAADATQDVMADMKAAVADMIDEPKEAIVEGKPAEEKPAANDEVADEEKPAEGDKSAEPASDGKPADQPVDTPADDDHKPKEPGEEKPEDEKPTEEKPADEKKEGEEEVKEPEPVEPSESEKLVEELGGVEVIKAAQPFVESVYDPSLPVSERVARLEKFVPEAQMKDMRNEFFWQAAESPEIHALLAEDNEAREVYAQRVFGVPFGYLQKVFEEHKGFFSEDDFTEALSEYKAENPEAAKTEKEKPSIAEVKKPEPPAPKKEEPKAEEKKDEPKELAPAFTSILDNLSNDVDAVFATAQLEPNDKDDADTARLKSEAMTKFAEDWPKAFMADETAMKAYRDVKGLVDQGAETQAKQKYGKLAKNAQRVAADLLKKVTEPLDAHRTTTKEKAKSVAAARTETPAAAKQAKIESPSTGAGVDLTSIRSDADITRMMEESIERNSKKS